MRFCKLFCLKRLTKVMETIPAKTGKKRFLNFTEEEKVFLLFHVQKYKDVIENKDIGSASVLRKKKAWSEITDIFNQEPENTKRTTRQLQTLFVNLKAKRKRELAKAEAKKRRLMPGFESYHKMSLSDTDDFNDKDEFSDDKDALTDDKDGSNDDIDDDNFTDENDDHIEDLVNSALQKTAYEPIIKVEPNKRKNNESLDSGKSLHELRIKEAELRLMLAKEQLEEAKIKKETASLVQQYEIKYYEEKIRALNNIHSGSQLQQLQ